MELIQHDEFHRIPVTRCYRSIVGFLCAVDNTGKMWKHRKITADPNTAIGICLSFKDAWYMADHVLATGSIDPSYWEILP